MFGKALDRLRLICWRRCRDRINRMMRARLTNRDVSVISSNCTGGIISHDLGLMFRSPTVNLFFRAEDFIRFCENLEYYMSIDRLEECTDPSVTGGAEYPVAFLGDIPLFLVHYSSVSEAERKWNGRKARTDRNNLVIIATDRDGMTYGLKDRFEKLPYRKVMFTHLPDEKHPSCFYISGYENGESVGIVTEPEGWGGKRPTDRFDTVGFLNGEAFGKRVINNDKRNRSDI